MKKIIRLLFVLAFVLIGCSNRKEANSGKEYTSTDTQTIEKGKEDTSTDEPDESDTPSKAIDGLRQVSMLYGNLGCSVENGYYHIVGKTVGSEYISYLCYVDYGSKKERYLCKMPNCKHDSEKCESCVDEALGGQEGVLFTDEKYLYLIGRSIKEDEMILYNPLLNESEEDIASPESCPVLYRMDMDGSHREAVYEFQKGQSVDENIFYDGEYLYLIVKEVVSKPLDKESVYMEARSKKIVQLSLDDFTCKDVTKLTPDTKVIGCTSDFLVLAKEEYDKKYSKESILLDSDKFQKARKTETLSIFRVDPNTQEQVPIKVLQDEGIKTYTVGQDSLYYGIEGSGVIKEINVADGKESTLLETTYDSIAGHTEDSLVCETAIHYDNQPKKLIDMQNGTSKDISILMNDDMPIQVIGGNSTSYLVERDVDETGQVIYALMSKTDYEQQVDQSTKINMIQRDMDAMG